MGRMQFLEKKKRSNEMEFDHDLNFLNSDEHIVMGTVLGNGTIDITCASSLSLAVKNYFLVRFE